MSIMKNRCKIYKEVPVNDGRFKNPIVTIGNFDGVHLGHRKIIDKLLERAEIQSGEAFLLTFNNHPRELLKPGKPCRMITTVEEKIEALENLGLKNIILLDFSDEILNLTAWQFYNDLLVERLGVLEIVIGYDHHFGKGREGNYDYLKGVAHHHNTIITKVDEAALGENIVSSTFLREKIDAGEVGKVKELLGRRFSLTGKIIHGEGRGKGLGAPTANIDPDLETKMTPGYGVYAVMAELHDGKRYRGVMSIGVNPTFNGITKSMEVHIFDFEEDIYGDAIKVEFVERLRDEKKYPNAEELMIQIKKDVEQAKDILSNID